MKSKKKPKVTVENQDKNGVRVRVHRTEGVGTWVDASCRCFGSDTRAHSNPTCPVFKKQKAATAPWLLNIVELPCPIRRGDQVRIPGEFVKVYEVRKLACLSTPIAGKRRPLFAVLHAGSGSVFVAVCLNGRQREWSV